MPLPARQLRAPTRDQERNPARELAPHRQAGLALRHRSPSFAAVELSQPLATAGAGQPRIRRRIFQAGLARTAASRRVPHQLSADQPRHRRTLAERTRRKVPAGVREVEFFANADDTQLLLDVGCAREARRAAVRDWAEEFRAAMPEIAGVVAFREPNPGDRKAGAPESSRYRRCRESDLSDRASGLPRQRRRLSFKPIVI